VAYSSPHAVDLSTYLGDTDIDEERADMLLALAEGLCLGIVNPLPAGAEAVVLDIVARAYTNPTNLTEQATGPYSAAYGAGGGGLWLTSRNEALLRGLGGTGQAFTIDPTPATAGPANYWAQVPEDPAQPYTNPPFYGDFDQIP
jgi:hypothetical protein